MTTYGQSVSGEERHDGARPRALADALGTVASRRPGHLEELVAAEIRQRWADRAWYRRRRDIAAATARSYEGAVADRGHWLALIDENERELRTLLRVRRKARRT